MSCFSEIIDIIKKNNNFFILSHVHSDGDSIGSSVALYLGLKKMNKKACVVFNKKEFNKYDFLLKYIDNLEKFKDGVVFSLDTSDLSILNNPYNLKVDVSIDHHATNSYFAEINYVNDSAASNSINVYNLLKEMMIEIDSKIAECILTGILTDTARFKNLNVNRQVFEISYILYEKVDFNLLSQKIFKKTKNLFDLKCKVLNKTRFFFNNKCSLCIVRMEDLNYFKVSYNELEEIPSATLEIESVIIAITIKEDIKNKFKISMRSNGSIDVLKICKYFGGGGHKNAGGFDINGEIKDIEQKILSYIEFVV